jgi:hypothetical protein
MAAFVASPGMAATKNKHKAKAPAAQTQTTKKPVAGQTDPDPKVNCELKRDPANCR